MEFNAGKQQRAATGRRRGSARVTKLHADIVNTVVRTLLNAVGSAGSLLRPSQVDELPPMLGRTPTEHIANCFGVRVGN